MGMLKPGRRSRMARQGLAPAPLADPEQVSTQRIAVVVVCHGNYLCFLPGAVHSIKRQIHQPTQRILVLDGCEPPEWMAEFPEWEIVRGQWGSPNPGRNAGLARVAEPWTVWFDADNEMAGDQLLRYAERTAVADTHAGLFYPDILYTDAQMNITRKRPMGDPDYWRLRLENYIDTSSCWRTAAVRSVGGWNEDTPNADDYALAAAMTAQGWHIERAEGAHTLMREHNRGRRSEPLWTDPEWYATVRWNIRSHALVTLFAGRQHLLPGYLRWLRSADLPPHTRFVAVDNSADATFAKALRRGLPWDRFEAVELRTVARQKPPGASRLAQLGHVARLYNDTLADCAEDMVAVVEDDVTGPADGLRQLYRAINRCGSPVGIIGGVYESPDRRGMACLSYAMDAWGESPGLDTVSPSLAPVGFIGAGFTWYAGWLLANALPVVVDSDLYHGWDAGVCLAAQRLGHFVMVDGRVTCTHHLEGR